MLASLHLQPALRLIFTGAQAGQHYEQSLASTKRTGDLVKFCTARSTESIHPLFVIDQVNALDPSDEESDRFLLDSAWTLLDMATSSHIKLSSSSGNYHHWLSPAAELLLDWRYFYVSKGIGKCNCGFARQVGASFLRQVMNAVHFLTPNWYESLRVAVSNPSMLGFFTEQMLLSYIGCPSAGPESLVNLLQFFPNQDSGGIIPLVWLAQAARIIPYN